MPNPRSTLSPPAFLLTAALAAALGMLQALPAHADEILCRDGSRLRGRILALENQHLHIDTQFAGHLTVPLDQIAALTTDQPVHVQLSDGSQFQGRLAAADEGSGLLLIHQDQQIPLTWDRLTDLRPLNATSSPQPDATPPASSSAETPSPTPSSTPPPPPPVHWKAQLELGLQGQSGNAEKFNLDARASLRRTSDLARLNLLLDAKFWHANHSSTTRYIRGLADLERDLSERWLAFAKTALEHDQREQLEWRSLSSAGLGYFLIRQTQHELKLRGGLGYTYESFRTHHDSSDDLIAELSLQWRRQFVPWLELTHESWYYPTLDAIQDYRLEMETAAVLPLDRDRTWHLRLGLRNKYNAQPEPGVDRLDTFYFLRLVVNLLK